MIIRHFTRFFTVSLAVFLIVAGCSTSRTASAQAVKPSKDRKAAPDFALKDAGGKQVKLSDYRGKAIVLDFWATWCGPCKIEIPWFIEFQRKYKDRGLVVLGVASGDEDWNVIKPFADQVKINYPIVLGNDMTADLYGGIEALPTTFIIDRDGRIAKVHIGLASKEDFENAIEKVLDAALSLSALLLNGQSSPALRVTPPEPVNAKPGSSFVSKVTATLNEGFHTNSHTPAEAYLIPLTLKWTAGTIEAGETEYPKPQMLKLPFEEKPLSVLTGQFTLTTKFKVPAGLQPGPTAVMGKLRYQACNDKACFPPKSVDVKLPVNVQ